MHFITIEFDYLFISNCLKDNKIKQQTNASTWENNKIKTEQSPYNGKITCSSISKQKLQLITSRSRIFDLVQITCQGGQKKKKEKKWKERKKERKVNFYGQKKPFSVWGSILYNIDVPSLPNITFPSVASPQPSFILWVNFLNCIKHEAIKVITNPDLEINL